MRHLVLLDSDVQRAQASVYDDVVPLVGVVIGQLESWEGLNKGGQGRGDLVPCQLCANAMMKAVAETKVRIRMPRYVQRLRVRENFRVTVGRCDREQHLRRSLDGKPADLEVFKRDARGILQGARVAYEFFDGRSRGPHPLERLKLLLVRYQRENALAKDGDRRLDTGKEEDDKDRDHLIVRQRNAKSAVLFEEVADK